MHSSDLPRETAKGCRNGNKFYLLERDPVSRRRLVQQVVRTKDARVGRLVVYLAAVLSGESRRTRELVKLPSGKRAHRSLLLVSRL